MNVMEVKTLVEVYKFKLRKIQVNSSSIVKSLLPLKLYILFLTNLYFFLLLFTEVHLAMIT